MQVEIDKDVCIGCGICESISPDVFEMGEDRVAHIVKSDTLTIEEVETVQDAFLKCPVKAIRIKG